MRKFNVGDRVQIKPRTNTADRYGVALAEGTVFKVTKNQGILVKVDDRLDVCDMVTDNPKVEDGLWSWGYELKKL